MANAFFTLVAALLGGVAGGVCGLLVPGLGAVYCVMAGAIGGAIKKPYLGAIVATAVVGTVGLGFELFSLGNRSIPLLVVACLISTALSGAIGGLVGRAVDREFQSRSETRTNPSPNPFASAKQSKGNVTDTPAFWSRIGVTRPLVEVLIATAVLSVTGFLIWCCVFVLKNDTAGVIACVLFGVLLAEVVLLRLVGGIPAKHLMVSIGVFVVLLVVVVSVMPQSRSSSGHGSYACVAIPFFALLSGAVMVAEAILWIKAWFSRRKR